MKKRLLLLALLVSAATPCGAGSSSNASGLEIFRNLVEIPSVPDRVPEVKRLLDYLKAKFEAAGLSDISLRDSDGTRSMILRWRAARPTRKPMLLLGHVDVVDAKRADWSKDPFKLTEEGGYFYGRGTIDMKNGVAAIANALIQLKLAGFQPKRDIVVLFTGDEEPGGATAMRAAKEWRQDLDAEFALNADAGNGRFLKDGTSLGFSLQVAEKLYQSYSFTTRNPGGHSSKPRPDNAIYDLANALRRLADHRFAPELIETTRAYFRASQALKKDAIGDAMRRWLADPADGAAADIIEADPVEVGQTRTRCVATLLEGGEAENALPQRARAIVNCRLLPGTPVTRVEAELSAIAGPKVAVEPFGVPATVAPASPLRPDIMEAFTRAVRKRHPGAPVIPEMSTGGSDGAHFRAVGMPVYGVNGSWIVVPDDDRKHGRDERIPVKSFYDNLDHWRDMIETLAG